MISSPPKLKAEADAKRQKNTEYIALLVCDQLFDDFDIFRQIKYAFKRGKLTILLWGALSPPPRQLLKVVVANQETGRRR